MTAWLDAICESIYHTVYCSTHLFVVTLYYYNLIFIPTTAPKLKGRPRKRRKVRRAGSPESESASSESSVSTASATVGVSDALSELLGDTSGQLKPPVEFDLGCYAGCR